MTRPRRAPFILVFALALGVLTAGAAAAEERVPSPWLAGLALGAEGFDAGSGLGGGERLSLLLTFDPFDGPCFLPLLAAGASLPLFPWSPDETLLEARLGLELVRAREHPFRGLMSEPSLYAPSLSVSLLRPLAGGEPILAYGLRPFALRTGDGLYSFLSPSLLGEWPGGGSIGLRGWSLELFEFTHYFLRKPR